ncbi:hypothetical protein SCLCIDRAFT_1213179 [Scleroderma citrinum Foug A]|uniref:Uncharacterized protein n=1 Tax=Scleroderma citrinum Foug A TaxID=1036808 RepID=A0A0C3E9M8_9AGAM|nr:hypothetical protein SCLCIDRAFT_1213179 [Scleroderma citrinum Foug A]
MWNAEKDEALRKFSEYPFSSDEVFQQGLIGILEHASAQSISEQERSDLQLRTQLFYFNRQTECDLSLDDVRSLTTEISLPSNSMPGPFTPSTREDPEFPPQINEDAQPPRVLNFVELKALIESGNTENIPHNKHIPDQVNECIPSRSNAPVRKKPWEAASPSVAI